MTFSLLIELLWVNIGVLQYNQRNLYSMELHSKYCLRGL